MDDLSYLSCPNNSHFRYESIIDVLYRRLEETPEREICIQRFVGGGRKSLTYKELVGRSTDIAKFLISRGIRPGDSVAIIGPNSVEWIIGEFAIFLTGAVAVQINKTSESFAETMKLINASRSKAVLLDLESNENYAADMEAFLSDRTPREKPTMVLLRKTTPSSLPLLNDVTLTVKENSVVLPRIQPESSAVIFTTSGSTGVPKMVEMTHFAIINAPYTALVGKGGTGEYGIFYNDRPFTWLGGSPIFSLLNGNVRVFLDTIKGTKKENIMDIWDIIVSEKCNNAVLLPYTLLDLLENQDINKHGYKLNAITTGGQVIGSHLTEICDKFTEKLYMVYGATEVREMCFLELTTEMEVGYVGPLLPGYEVKVIGGNNGETLNRGCLGEILIRSPWMLKSYRNAPELNATSIVDGGWFRTGDIGIIDTDSKLFIKGKSTDVVKRGGVKVLTSVVETAMNQLPEVKEVVILSVPDVRLLEEVCACYIPESHSKSKEYEIKQKCQKTLGDNVLGSTPSYFLHFDTFPRLSNGKTDKIRLKKIAIERLNLT